MAFLNIKTFWSSYYDVTSVDFNSEKIHKDKIFDRQDFLRSIQSLQICKISQHEIGTLKQKVLPGNVFEQVNSMLYVVSLLL